LLVANPPYLTEAEYAALTIRCAGGAAVGAGVSGADGLSATRRILEEECGSHPEDGW
jgi:methylase of polypeptide subunit release factors